MIQGSPTAAKRRNRSGCVLVSGFGPFPGAAFNPSAPLAARLARTRRPAFSALRLVDHTFTTSYAAVDRDLPMLLAQYRPDIVLMFGVAPRAKTLRIEMFARNAISRFPDALRFSPPSLTIATGRPAKIAGKAPFRRMLRAARGWLPTASLSRHAGRYLCNYVYRRALESAALPDGPRLVAFVHVPRIRANSYRRNQHRRPPPALPDLVRAANAILAAMVGELNRSACARSGKD